MVVAATQEETVPPVPQVQSAVRAAVLPGNGVMEVNVLFFTLSVEPASSTFKSAPDSPLLLSLNCERFSEALKYQMPLPATPPGTPAPVNGTVKTGYSVV